MTIAKKSVVVGALAVALVFLNGINQARAQESDAGSTPTRTTDAKAPIPPSAYRLDYSIHELEDGRKINTRHYSLNVNENDANELKIGTRVPVEVKAGETEYIDVGTSLNGRTQVGRDAQVKIFVRVDMSNFALPEQADGHDRHPLIRQLRISGSTVVEFGKPTVMGVVDDPNSKRQFQLELTVTKLR